MLLLFAAETADRAGEDITILVTAHNVTDAIAETIRRTGYRPTAIWTFEGAQRRLVNPNSTV